MSNSLLAFIPRIYSKKLSSQTDFINDSFPSKLTYSDVCVIRSKDNGITWDTTSTIITNSGLINCEVYTGGKTIINYFALNKKVIFYIQLQYI
jgi:hypothetical protein